MIGLRIIIPRIPQGPCLAGGSENCSSENELFHAMGGVMPSFSPFKMDAHFVLSFALATLCSFLPEKYFESFPVN